MIKILIKNSENTISDLITLPTSTNSLKIALDKLNIKDKNYSLKIVQTDYYKVKEVVKPDVDVFELNEFIKFLDDLRADDYEYDKYCAIVDFEKIKDFSDLCNVMSNFDNWDLVWVETYAELGDVWANWEDISIPDDFDYEEYGLEIARKLGGIMTDVGYVYKI